MDTKLSRARDESIIELDIEYIRPRYTLVFSISAVFLLIVLNVGFWYEYVEVIIWAIAASQMIRPLTDDTIRAIEKLYKARQKTKRNVVLLFFEVIVQGQKPADASPDLRVVDDNSFLWRIGLGKVVKKIFERRSLAFVFNHPTAFLIVAMCYHLMPMHIFLAWAISLSVLVVFFSIISDFIGLTDAVLRSLMRRDVMSMILIASIMFFLVAVDLLLILTAMVELADAFETASSGFSVFLASLSKDDKAMVASVSVDMSWAQENALKLYEYSSREFGQRKWWTVIETVRRSVETGDSVETMARAGINQMRVVYNDTEWVSLVEMAVMAAVPKPSVASTSVSFVEMFNRLSWRSLWLSMGEFAWRFSAAAWDTVKYMSEFAGQVAVFFFIAQQLCNSRRDVITCICMLTVPASSKSRTRLNDDLRSALRSALTDPITAAHKSALVVLLVYGVLDLPGAFISAAVIYLVGLLHIFPEVLALLICAMPWASYQLMRFYIAKDYSDIWLWHDLLRGVSLPLLLVEITIYANIVQRHNKEMRKGVSPWLTDFSLAVGISKFGIFGLILGPFLIAVTYVVLNFVLTIAEQTVESDKTIAEITARQHLMSQSTLHSASYVSADRMSPQTEDKIDEPNLSNGEPGRICWLKIRRRHHHPVWKRTRIRMSNDLLLGLTVE